MNIEFCNSTCIESKIIHLINRLIFQTQEEEIAAIYNIFRDRFSGKDYPKDPELIKLYIRERTSISLLKNFNIKETDKYIGVDFPSWFNFTDEKPKIMLVAIDPYRDKGFEDCISIGSPFALHDAQCKVEKEGTQSKNLYWNLISKLSEKYAVYVTDTFKVYFRENGVKNKNSYNCRRFTNPPEKIWSDEIHQKIFAEEVAIVRPQLIVTLGAHPVRWFSSLKKFNYKQLKQSAEKKDKQLYHGSVPILPLVHLSGRTTSTAVSLYEVKKAELPEKYLSMIESYINELN